jgi:hypothetical protein
MVGYKFELKKILKYLVLLQVGNEEIDSVSSDRDLGIILVLNFQGRSISAR